MIEKFEGIIKGVSSYLAAKALQQRYEVSMDVAVSAITYANKVVAKRKIQGSTTSDEEFIQVAQDFMEMALPEIPTDHSRKYIEVNL